MPPPDDPPLNTAQASTFIASKMYSRQELSKAEVYNSVGPAGETKAAKKTRLAYERQLAASQDIRLDATYRSREIAEEHTLTALRRALGANAAASNAAKEVFWCVCVCVCVCACVRVCVCACVRACVRPPTPPHIAPPLHAGSVSVFLRRCCVAPPPPFGPCPP